jgi:hypothetical protein
VYIQHLKAIPQTVDDHVVFVGLSSIEILNFSTAHNASQFNFYGAVGLPFISIPNKPGPIDL